MLPTPPEAPVTTTGPSPGASPFCSSRWSESAAVNPAVPTMAAWRVLRPVGNGTTHSAGTRANSAKPPSWATPRS
jgi:hypothetical protein